MTLSYDLSRLPSDGWLSLDDAMKFALCGQLAMTPALPGSLLFGVDDADTFNERVFLLQTKLNEAARAERLLLRGRPKRFYEDEPSGNTGSRVDIPSDYFNADGVRGFDYDDGSILPYALEGDDLDKHGALSEPHDGPDEWRFVVLRREGFVEFLRGSFGAEVTDPPDGLSGDQELPDGGNPDEILTIENGERLQKIVRVANERLGGTSINPIHPKELHNFIRRELAGNARVARTEVDLARDAVFPKGLRAGSGRLSRMEKEARKQRRIESEKKPMPDFLHL